MQQRITELDTLLESISVQERRTPSPSPSPTATPVQLEEQIAKAKAAQAVLDQQARTQAVAQSLTALEEQLSQQHWIEEVTPVADRAEEEAIAILQNVQPQMEHWQLEFIDTVAKLERLVAHLPELQNPIYAAVHKVKQVAATRLKIAKLQGNNVSEISLGYDWHELWMQIGGTNEGLSPLPLEDANAHKRLYRWLPLIKSLSQQPFIVHDPRNVKLFNRL